MQERGFAATGRAGEGDDIAFVDHQRNAVQHRPGGIVGKSDVTNGHNIGRFRLVTGLCLRLWFINSLQPIDDFRTGTHRRSAIMIMLGQQSQRLEKLRGEQQDQQPGKQCQVAGRSKGDVPQQPEADVNGHDGNGHGGEELQYR